MSENITLARAPTEMVVEAFSAQVEAKIWFKSLITRDLCYRATQLQLWTTSHDQGWYDDKSQGAWTWFEVCILEKEDSTAPLVKDDKKLTWKSHFNRLSHSIVPFRHYGIIFDRRHEIFNELRIGGYLGVRVCAQYSGWTNNAVEGKLRVNRLTDVDLFFPVTWKLPRYTGLDKASSIKDGVYTVTAPHDCHVKAASAEVRSQIWFATPALDEETVRLVTEIRLFTFGRYEGPSSSSSARTGWFDIAILDTPTSNTPRKLKGQQLVWFSHRALPAASNANSDGKSFTRVDDSDLFNRLKAGNAIGVRVCARFEDCQNLAKKGRLVVTLSSEGSLADDRSSESKDSSIMDDTIDMEDYAMSSNKLQDAVRTRLPCSGSETEIFTEPPRIDVNHGSRDPPLNLLCLGGIRGLSSLYILKALFNGDENVRPWEHFDMIAGTSTGGLIAIMLGRLRMTIGECIASYETLSKVIFKATFVTKLVNGWNVGARYNASNLEDAVKEVIAQFSQERNSEEIMHDPTINAESGHHQCRVFVVATDAQNVGKVVRLRTYVNDEVLESHEHIKIWQAARATTAAPTYFERMKIDDRVYANGGLKYNNPVMLLLVEAKQCYGAARPISRVVSVGTGIAPNIILPGEGTGLLNVVKTAKTLLNIADLAMSSEPDHATAKQLCQAGTYYRFSMQLRSPPTPGRQKGLRLCKRNSLIRLDDHKRVGEIIELTEEYIHQESVALEIKACQESLLAQDSNLLMST